MQIITVVLTVTAVVLTEIIGFLTYTVVKMKKELDKNTNNFNELAECVLNMVKRFPDAEVIETYDQKSTDFNFPSKEGF